MSLTRVKNITTNLGISQANPDAEIHVSTARPHLDIEDTASGARAKIGSGYTNTYLATTHGSGEIIFKNNVGGSDFPHSSGTTLMTIGASGDIRAPLMPGWHGTHSDAYNSSYSAGQAHNMDASLERYNVGNHFNYSNNRFTCPVTGYYLVYGWDIALNAASIYDAGNAIGCWKNGYSGANRIVSVYRQYNRGYQFTSTAYLAANDYVTFGNSESAIGAGAYYGSLSYSGYGIRLLG